MRQKIIAENGRFLAQPMTGTPGEWLIKDDERRVGHVKGGMFNTFTPLSVNEILTVAALMLRIHHVERGEEKVLKTKNEENGN
jgi:hypothetical protein